MDEETLKRWMTLEVHTVNQATVTRPRPLTDLLAEDEPTAPRKDGTTLSFDAEALEAFADGLSPLARVNVRLPITVFVSHEASGDCYVRDEAAIEALQQHEITQSRPRDGKLWIGAPLARDFAKRFPTVLQFVIT